VANLDPGQVRVAAGTGQDPQAAFNWVKRSDAAMPVVAAQQQGRLGQRVDRGLELVARPADLLLAGRVAGRSGGRRG
jgi:hypothetical protein